MKICTHMVSNWSSSVGNYLIIAFFMIFGMDYFRIVVKFYIAIFVGTQILANIVPVQCLHLVMHLP